MAYQILLVEDDPQIREVICDFLQEKSQGDFSISIAKDGSEGMEMSYEKEYDLVILDVMLPGTDGFEICKEIRKNSITPIMFLTARGREEDILYGYGLGCDDYVTKPCSLAQLYAKCKALLKRSKGLVLAENMQCGKITLNPTKFEVLVDGEKIDLPPKEYLLLKFMMEREGMVISREMLLERIWGYDFEGNDRVVDNHVKKLRAALGDAGRQIKTVIGRGYKIG